MAETEITKPTTTLDAEARFAAEEPESAEDRKKRLDEQFATAAGPAYVIEGNASDAFVGTDPIYQNYADVTHQPFAAEEGAEAELEKRALAAMAARTENSKQASGGFTNYGAAVEVDPVGRNESIVRGGTGNAAADREAVAAASKAEPVSASKPRASEGGGKAKE